MSEINVESYLDDSQIREIITEELRRVVSKDAERIISNTAYHHAAGIIADTFDDVQAEAIRTKTLEVINNITDYTVFHIGTYWEKPQPTRDLMNRIVLDNEPLLREKIVSTFGAAIDRELRDADIPQIISDFVYELFASRQNKAVE